MSSTVPTLTALLRARATQEHEHPLVFLKEGEAEERTMTRREIDRQACAIAAVLQQTTKPGDRALLLYAPGLDLVPAFFGALYAGLVAVPVSPPRPGMPMTELLAFAADAAPSVVLTTGWLQQALAPLMGTALPPLPIVATDTVAPAPEGWRPHPAAPADLAALLYTSGSTSRPRGVMMSHDHLIQRLAASEQVFEAVDRQGPRGAFVSWLPLHHVMGLAGSVLMPFYMDFTAVLMSPVAFIEKPVRWLRAITRYQAIASSGPNFAFQACVDQVSPEEREGLDLSPWRAAVLAAESIRLDTLEAFARVYAPYGFRRSAYYTSYALSEGNGTLDGRPLEAKPVVFRADREALKDGRARAAAPEAEGLPFVSSGAPVPGQEVCVVDPHTRIGLGDDAVGEVWMRGRQVAGGYWNQPALTAETFEARRADTGAGPYLRTGDLGFFHDGDLYIAGRLKDMILVRGKNVYAVDVEQVAEGAHAALLAGASAAFGVEVDGEEQLVLVHELRPGQADADLEAVAFAVRAAVGAAHGLSVPHIVFVEAGSLPRTETGKIQRQRAREQYLEAHGPDAG